MRKAGIIREISQLGFGFQTCPNSLITYIHNVSYDDPDLKFESRTRVVKFQPASRIIPAVLISRYL